jgi:hypothetical protein
MGINTALRDHEESSSNKADQEWEAFQGSDLHKAMKEHRFETLLADPDNLWEAIGPDAIKYPFDTTYLPKTEARREEIIKRMKSFNQALATNITTMIITKDDAELGRVIRNMAETYMEEPVDEWVSKNWRAWG